MYIIIIVYFFAVVVWLFRCAPRNRGAISINYSYQRG